MHEDDATKYEKTGHALCDLIDKSHIYLGSHHKVFLCCVFIGFIIQCSVFILTTHKTDWKRSVKLSIISKNNWTIFKRAMPRKRKVASKKEPQHFP